MPVNFGSRVGTLYRTMRAGAVPVPLNVKPPECFVRITKVSLDEKEHVGWTTAKGVAKLFEGRVYWDAIKTFSPALGPGTDREFFDALQFLPDQKRYNVHLQVALIRIAAEDVELALSR